MKSRTMAPKAPLARDRFTLAPISRRLQRDQTAEMQSAPLSDGSIGAFDAPIHRTYGHSFGKIAVFASSPAASDQYRPEVSFRSQLPISATAVGIQRKLKINEPGDHYEKEADRIAEQVMRMQDPRLQRQCCCGTPFNGGSCEQCKKKQELSGTAFSDFSLRRTPKDATQQKHSHCAGRATTSKKRIQIDLSDQTIVATEDGKEVFRFDVVSGRSGQDTPLSPPGNPFRVTKKCEHYRSKAYDSPMEHSLFFVERRGIAIHESNYVGLRRFLKLAGIPFAGSHGCVGLSKDDAKKLFDWATVGTTVEVAHSHNESDGSKDDAEGQHLHRKEIGPGETGQAAPLSVYAVLKTGGKPLDAETRAFFEPRFGHDFSAVRVHDDSRAAESAGAVHARAYTVGGEIVFNAGEYAPKTVAGNLLLAHELVHTIHQGAAKPMANEESGELSVGSVSRAVQCWPGDGMTPPGDCSWPRYVLLRGSVETAKAVSNMLGGCSPGDSCLRLATRIAAYVAEITEREFLMVLCFKGGDSGHREQVAQLLEKLKQCHEYFRNSNCSPDLITAMAVVVEGVRDLIAAATVALAVSLIAGIIALLDVIAGLLAAAAEAAAEIAAIGAAIQTLQTLLTSGMNLLQSADH